MPKRLLALNIIYFVFTDERQIYPESVKLASLSERHGFGEVSHLKFTISFPSLTTGARILDSFLLSNGGSLYQFDTVHTVSLSTTISSQ